jgi:hypothetical protein
MELKVGQVFHLWCNACRPPWNKFHVLASISPGPWFFLINSAPTAFQLARAHLMSSMIELQASDVNFLNADSWLDCSQLLGGHSAQLLEDLVKGASSDYLGRLETHHRRAIRAVIAQSRVLSKTDKQHLLAAW